MNSPSKILLITNTADPAFGGWGKYTHDLVAALKGEGVHVSVEYIQAPLRLKRHFFLGWWAALRLFFKYRGKDIHVVHCVVEPYAFITSLLAFFLRVPYVLTLHGTYSIILLDHPVYKIFQSWSYRHAKSLVAVSAYTKFRIEKYLHLKNLTVIPNGIDCTVVDTPRTLNETPRILSVGGVKKRKGYHLVIEALGKIKKELGDFTYTIVGDTQDSQYVDKLRSLIAFHCLQDQVVIAGKVSEEQKEKLYSEAHLLVLTPVSEGSHFEGFGLVYLEANAKGIPVVGTTESGAESAIKNGYNGLLALSEDPIDIGAKIMSLLSDGTVYEQFSARALQHARDGQWVNKVKLYLELYQFTY